MCLSSAMSGCAILTLIRDFYCSRMNKISEWFVWLLKNALFCFCHQVESIEWAYDDIGEITSKGQLNNMADFLAHKQLDLVINLPMRHGGARRVSSFSTHGKLFQVTQLWYCQTLHGTIFLKLS